MDKLESLMMVEDVIGEEQRNCEMTRGRRGSLEDYNRMKKSYKELDLIRITS